LKKILLLVYIYLKDGKRGYPTPHWNWGQGRAGDHAGGFGLNCSLSGLQGETPNRQRNSGALKPKYMNSVTVRKNGKRKCPGGSKGNKTARPGIDGTSNLDHHEELNPSEGTFRSEKASTSNSKSETFHVFFLPLLDHVKGFYDEEYAAPRQGK